MNINNPYYNKLAFFKKIALVIFSALIVLVLLEMGLRLGRFIVLTLQEHRITTSIRQRGQYRILCLGESTTQDQDPRLLEAILDQANTGLRFSVINKGRDGLNSGIIVSQTVAYLDKYRPDMVVVMMGACDWAELLPYEKLPHSKITLFITSMRTYKLTRSLWLHMAAKAKEIGLYKLGESSKETGGNNKVAYGKETDYVKLGMYCQSQGQLRQSEEYFKKALELNFRNDAAYVGLGMLYQFQGRMQQAEEYFKKALKLNSRNDSAYAWLGMFYKYQEQPLPAEEHFKKALELNPRNDLACLALGMLYQSQNKPQPAEEYFKKALELNPRNDVASVRLGKFYLARDEWQQAEGCFKKSLEVDPKNEEAWIGLGNVYQYQGRLQQAEECLKKSLGFNPYNISRLYGALAVVYGEAGQLNLSQKYFNKEKELELGYYNSLTVHSYHKLKEILDKRNIKFVCVQYPMRDVRALEKMFEDQGSIIFVDNEKTFKDAVKRDGYKEYFRDMFGGDFGHCTKKGNQLLAENITNAILKEALGR